MGIKSGRGVMPEFKHIRNGKPVRHAFSDKASALRQIPDEQEIKAVLFASIHDVKDDSDFLSIVPSAGAIGWRSRRGKS